MKLNQRTVFRSAAAAAALVLCLSAVWIVRARHALEEARHDVAEAKIGFKVTSIDVQPTVVDFLASPPDFRYAQIFHDLLYVCGSGGIWVYDLAGNLRTSYLVGRDLPPSPPIAMVAGSLAGDAEAKLWIATAGAGIVVFDGTRFSQIQLDGKGYGNVTAVSMLPTGVLLIGFSEAGVLAYSGSGIAPFHPSLTKISVTAIAGDEGDLWVGTRDRGVIHWRAGSAEEFNDRNGLPDNRVLSIATLNDRVFVGTPVGISEFRDGKYLRNIAGGVFSRALLPATDDLLIATVDQGIVELPLTDDRAPRIRASAGLNAVAARQLLEIEGKDFALNADGLYEREFRNGLWTRRIAVPASTWTDRNISALSVDPMGKLWIGYFDRGIDIADADGVHKPTHIEDDEVFCVNRLLWDANRNMQLAATANGVVLLSPEGKVLRRIGQSDGLISDHATDVAIRPDGLAVATAAGVTLLDAAGPESIYAFQGLANNHVYTLAASGTRLLAGTLGGVSLIENGFVRASYTTANSPLRHNWISAAVPYNGGFIIGTYGGGIIQLDATGQWTNFEDIPPHTVINPNAMLTLSNGIIAGTLDRGLLVFDAANHRWNTFTGGLPSLNVTALAVSSGKLFVGTDNGIVRMPVEKVLQ